MKRSFISGDEFLICLASLNPFIPGMAISAKATADRSENRPHLKFGSLLAQLKIILCTIP
jgi:hypothetical protein